MEGTASGRGGQPYHDKPTGNIVSPVEPTLSDLGLTKRESAEAQMLAIIPEEEFENIKLGKNGRHEDMNQDDRIKRIEQATGRFYEVDREPKRHLSRIRRHKKGKLIRYDPREELSFLDAEEARESRKDE